MSSVENQLEFQTNHKEVVFGFNVQTVQRSDHEMDLCGEKFFFWKGNFSLSHQFLWSVTLKDVLAEKQTRALSL